MSTAVTYWQVAAGSAGRDYSDRFLRHGILFVGGEGQIKKVETIAEGDIVILKQGLNRILAVGQVVVRDGKHQGCGDKQWLDDFDGWELPAYCYVDWRIPDQPICTDGLTRAAIQRVWQPKHTSIADRLLLLPKAGVDPEPSTTKAISDDEILRYLIKEGLRTGAADELTVTLKRIRLLAEYYCECWNDVSEHDIRTFLVIPLLLSLGWSEQQMRIERKCSAGRVDIACFSPGLLSEARRCLLLVETKALSSGLDYAPEQARRYAVDFPSCQVIVVTNGYCYKTYTRSVDGAFGMAPAAYLNILAPCDRYPLDPVNVEGALGVLKWLLPRALG